MLRPYQSPLLAPQRYVLPFSIVIEPKLLRQAFQHRLLLTLAVEVENRFRIILEQEDEAAIRSVGDLVDTVQRKLSAGAE